MIRILLSFFFSILLVGCGPKYVDYFPYHDDGSPKPKIALLPVINACDYNVPWDLASEFTNGFRYQAMCNGDLFLLSDREMEFYMGKCANVDYFGCDISWAKNFCQANYIVAFEVVEHTVAPYQKGQLSPAFPAQSNRCNSVLQMKVRLRIIDLTCGCPKIALQEIFTSNYIIPKECECIDYNRICWGSNAFPTTPYGLAHKRLMRDLVNRVVCVTQGR